MCAQSIREFINAPSLLGFAFVIIDGAALAPFIPSSGYIRRGASAIIDPSAIKRLSKTEDGMNAILNSTRGVKRFGDVTSTVRTLARSYDLSDYRYVNHILEYHGFQSKHADKSKFKTLVDIKSLIDDALTSPNSIIKQNTEYFLEGRKGFTIEYKTGSNSIGVDTNGMLFYKSCN